MRLVLPALLLAGCAFNVGVRGASRDATTADTFTGVRSDLRAAGLRDGVVRVTGAARSGALATASAGALVSGGGEPALELAWRPAALGVAELVASSSGETSWLASVEIEIPTGTALDLDVAGADVEVVATSGPVRVHAAGNDLDVRGATSVDLVSGGGSVSVEAERGTIESRGGAVALAVTGEVEVLTNGGRITGTFGGGTLRTVAGAVDVTLRAAPSADVTIESGGGAVTLGVPIGVSLVLDASGGRVRIAAGGVDFDGTGSTVRTLGAGGPTVTIRAGAGVITVLER